MCENSIDFCMFYLYLLTLLNFPTVLNMFITLHFISHCPLFCDNDSFMTSILILLNLFFPVNIFIVSSLKMVGNRYF